MRKLPKRTKTELCFATNKYVDWDKLQDDLHGFVMEHQDISPGCYYQDLARFEPKLEGLKFVIFRMRPKKNIKQNSELITKLLKDRGFVLIRDEDRDLNKVLSLAQTLTPQT